MKNITVKIIALIMALLIAASCLFGCSSLGEPLLGVGKTEFSENIYMLFLSRLKGTMASAQNYSTEALTDNFWDMVVSNDGKTREESFKQQILEECKLYAAALELFDTLGLKLPDSYVDEIDTDMKDLLDGDGGGSKTSFNSILSSYGANYDILRESYIIEAKLSYLNEYLYGSKGERIGNEVIRDYYESNYYRFKHIFFYTYDLVYETDKDGKDIYYSEEGKGKIAYDTSAKKRRDSAGKEVVDKNGDVIYENDKGEIAYDKKNGQRQPVYDEKGYVVTREFTKEELIAVSDHATLLMEELEGKEGNYTLFDSYVKQYSEDEGSTKYENGIYVTAQTNYSSPEVIEAVVEMKEGEIRQIHSDYGIHIVMKYELEEDGYGKTANSDFFVSANSGTYVFLSDLMSILLKEKLKDSIASAWVDDERYDAISIKNLGANFYY